MLLDVCRYSGKLQCRCYHSPDRLQTLFVPVFHINTDSLMRVTEQKVYHRNRHGPPGYIDNGNLCYDKFDGTEVIRISPDGFKIWNVEGT